MKNYKHTIIAAIIIFVLVPIIFLNVRESRATHPPLRIGINDWPGYAIIPFAQKKGLFKKYNLNVEVTLVHSLPELNKQFSEHIFDGTASIITDLVLLARTTDSVKSVLILDQSIDGDVLLADPAIKKISELKGKTISFESVNSFSHLFVLHLLQLHGVKESEVNFTQVSVADVPEAIRSKKIAAGHTFSPTKAKGLKMGQVVIGRAADLNNLVTDVLIFHKSVLEQRPEDIKKFTRAYFEALAEFLNDPKAAADLLKDFYKNDPDEFIQSLLELHFVNSEENKKIFDRTQPNNIYEIGRFIADFLMSRGQLSHKENLNLIITGEFLP